MVAENELPNEVKYNMTLSSRNVNQSIKYYFSMHVIIINILYFVFISSAMSDVPFVEHPNGDLTVKIITLTDNQIANIENDFSGNQGKCVRFHILDFQDYEVSEAIMRIPSERHGVEFEPNGDGDISVICSRFTEDYYDYNGNLESSVEYEKIEGY